MIINNVNNVTVWFNYENRTVDDLRAGFYCFNFSDINSSAIYIYIRVLHIIISVIGMILLSMVNIKFIYIYWKYVLI